MFSNVWGASSSSLFGSVQEPLLRSRSGVNGPKGESKWAWAAPRAALDWWSVTTSRTYLRSSLSRRVSWRWLIPVVSMCDVAEEVLCQGIQLPFTADVDLRSCTTWIWLVLSLAASRWLPRQKLLSDVALALLFLAYAFCNTSLSSLEAAADTDQLLNLFWLVTVLHIGGVHACLVFASYFTWAVHALRMSRSMDVLATLPFALAPFVVDYNCAKFYKQWEVQRSGIENLLNRASNGFCSIDRSSGVVYAASSELEHTFASPGLVGGAFVEHVEGISSWEEFLSCCTSDEGKLHTTLMTCCTSDEKKLIFEAKLIPYASSDSLISLCVQVLGEKRKAQVSSERLPFDFADFNSSERSSYEEVVDASRLHAQISKDARGEGETESERLLARYEVPRASLDSSGAVAANRQQARAASLLSYSDTNGTSADAASRSNARSEVSWAVSTASQQENDGQTSSRPRRHTTPASSSSGSPRDGLLRVSRTSTGSGEDGHAAELKASHVSMTGFRRTPRKTSILSLVLSMKRWEVPPRCCRWHAALAEVGQVLKELSSRSQACDHSWTPLQGWQCEQCLGLNDTSDFHCQVCRTCRYEGVQQHAGGSRPSTASRLPRYKVSL